MWRCQGERYSDCNIVEVIAMISWSLLSDRMQALWGDDFILVQDNARPHTVRVFMIILEDEVITVMDWPARSPDLNPRTSVGHAF